MSEKLSDALQDCLAALESGEDLDSILARFPELEADLRPFLEAAETIRESAEFSVPSEAIQRSRTRLLGHAAKLLEKRPVKKWFGLPRATVVILTAAFAVLMGVRGLVSASAQALPGDPLYTMKRTVETASLSLISNNQRKLDLQRDYNQRRKDETLALLKLDRSESVTFEGIVEEITPDFWIVDEIKIQVTSQTKIVGEIKTGMGVEVSGVVQTGGWVEALSITLKTYQISGRLQQIQDHHWVVNNTGFEINENTLMDDDFEIGDDVIILLQLERGGELTALAIIEWEDGSGSSDDKTTPEVELDESPTDDVEELDDDEDQSETPEPTHISEEPEDTDTVEPEDTDELEPTQEPQETEEPDDTDEPDHTSEPDDTPDLDDTPDPDDTPEPDDTPDD